jgi:AcrR family transcriptional regulator
MAATAKRTDPLTRTEIAKAALQMVDRDGVENLSMRRLAQELGVTTMAVYHHFENKAEILQAAADQVWIEAVVAIPEVDDPVESVIQGFLTTRQVFHHHSDLTPYAFASPSTDDAIHVTAVGIADGFERMGFRGLEVGDAYFVLATYTFGSGVLHAERELLDRSIRQPVSDIGDLAPPHEPEDPRPSYVSVRDAMGRDPGLERFERGLRTIMAGLVARVGLRGPDGDQPAPS